MAKRAHQSGSYEDPLTWLLGGLLDLLYLGLDRLIGQALESLIRRLPHR